MNAFRRAALAAVSLLALGAPVAHAQAAAPAEDGGDSIVVTAQRRSENLSQVPLSVGVLRHEQLSDYTAAAGDTLLTLSGKVPSLYAESTTGRIFPRFYIRGLGNIDFYLGASQPVSVIQDDVVQEHVVLKSTPAFDVDHVEVLRGPQGSLFGRNTTAGIIKFDTVKPSAELSGYAQASWGSRNAISLETGAGGALNEAGSLSMRVSSLYQHRSSWVSNTYNGTSYDGTVGGKNVMGGLTDTTTRLQLRYQPGSDTDILLSGQYRFYMGSSTLFYRGSVIKGTNQVPASLNLSQVAYDEGQNNTQSYNTGTVALHVTQSIGTLKLTSITAWEHTSGYSRGDTDGGAAANFTFNGVANGYGQSQGRVRGLNQWSEELRLSNADTARLKWQVGAIYFDSRDNTEFDQRGYFLTPSATGYNPNQWVLLHNINVSWGIFGQASYAINDQLTLTGGVRESFDSKQTAIVKPTYTAAGAQAYFGANYVRLADTQPSWDVSLLFKASNHTNWYARIARGFRGPTIQGRSAVFNSNIGAAGAQAGSESNLSEEMGLKNTWLDNKLHFNIDVFHYTVKNIQLNGNDSNGNGVLFNADRAIGYGLEADADYHPTSRLKLNAGLSLLHTEIKDPNVYAQTCGLNGVMVCTVLNPYYTKGTGTSTAYYAQINGNPLPNAPKWNVNFGARYDLPVKGGVAYISTDWNWQGYTSLVPYKTVEFTSNGNYEGGLKIGFDTGHYEIAGYVRNITDKRNLIGVIENYMAGVYNDPRTFGVMLRMH
ncbi:MAG TPA: TonB-dependent receptor [Novosphingobium sp.]|nr:TonB-dependent receptor [Novosphingobium sp.]